MSSSRFTSNAGNQKHTGIVNVPPLRSGMTSTTTPLAFLDVGRHDDVY
ncbi:MAG: hypothetical protein U1A28_04370 [Patescibacteria group bacterium]|nr:hypothetical protein [Patescibacteria group bacterium]